MKGSGSPPGDNTRLRKLGTSHSYTAALTNAQTRIAIAGDSPLLGWGDGVGVRVYPAPVRPRNEAPLPNWERGGARSRAGVRAVPPPPLVLVARSGYNTISSQRPAAQHRKRHAGGPDPLAAARVRQEDRP